MTAYSSTEAYPIARVDHLVITEVIDHTLIYDTRSHELHRLDPVAATIWAQCDGVRSIADLATLATVTTGRDVSAMSVTIALERLGECNLLLSPVASAQPGLSRRQAMKYAAAGITIPAIISITAPEAAYAESGFVVCNGTNCERGQICCGGITCSHEVYCCNGTACPLGSGACDPVTGGCGCPGGTSFCTALGSCANVAECDSATCSGSFRWCPGQNPGDPQICQPAFVPCPF